MTHYGQTPAAPPEDLLTGNHHYARAHNPTLSPRDRDKSSALAAAYEMRANTLIALAETYRADGDRETYLRLRTQAEQLLGFSELP